jgi:hypothetical protein
MRLHRFGNTFSRQQTRWYFLMTIREVASGLRSPHDDHMHAIRPVRTKNDGLFDIAGA